LNGNFPKVLISRSTRKYNFLYALSDTGFRSFMMNDVPPALWPHALARVNMYPSLIFHLLLQIPGSSNFWCSRSTGKRTKSKVPVAMNHLISSIDVFCCGFTYLCGVATGYSSDNLG
jgi:hypothetical protein